MLGSGGRLRQCLSLTRTPALLPLFRLHWCGRAFQTKGSDVYIKSHRKLIKNHLKSPASDLLQSLFKMSKIVVFTEEGFKGRTAEFKNNVRDLEERGFNNVISSLKVIGAPWAAYDDKNFAGKQRVFQEGEYAALDDKGRFSSLKMIIDDLDNPEIQLFEHVHYQGRSVTLRRETNLHDIAFSDTVSSHKVKGGVWVLYEHVNRQGSQLISYPGEEIPSYFLLSFNDVASPCCQSHRQHHSKYIFCS